MKWSAIFLLVVCAFAAVSRDAYREAYRSWREADPNLERDAAAAGPAFRADIDRVASEAAQYIAARAAYLTESAAAQEQALAWLNQERGSGPAASAEAARIVTSQIAAVRHSLDTYGNDPDPGIQQVRTMLARENVALVSLATVMADAGTSVEQANAATALEQSARLKALTQVQDSVAAIKQQVAAVKQEGSDWAEYYRKLSDAARAETPAPVTPVPVTPAAAPAPEPAPPTVSITPVPLARYTGAWVFPASNGLFHGPPPEFIDLVVHEENGRATGTLFARFKVTGVDPVLRFDFSGPFQKTRNQTFDLQTSDGAKGTIELIPGPAFNLLEINFLTEFKAGKVQKGNAVLVKK